VLGRLEAAAAERGMTPFVGREDELHQLMNLWERVLEGEAQVALIIGEAGIGKSRLLQRIHEQIAATPHTWVETAATPFFQNSPFYLITDLLRQFLRWRRGEPSENLFARLESALELAGLNSAEAIPLIAPLLNVSVHAKYPPSVLTPEQQRRRLLTILVEWVLGIARIHPLIIAIEDLHWADPSTLELVQLLVAQSAMGHLLLLYTARPEFRIQWPLRPYHTRITLDRLPDRQAREMVESIAAGMILPPQIFEAVVGRATGVPLFVEELTRDMLERGEHSTQHEIPATLHDSLMERLDRLGPAREVAQIAAAIGREFSYELLRTIAGLVDDQLQSALGRLISAELLYARGIPPDASYVFKHALVRDAAYDTLLKSLRRDLHRRIAETLLERFSEFAASAPELLAHHYTEAVLPAQAVRYWRLAGRSANERSAYAEAIAHFNRGLELVSSLPETPARISEALRLQIALTGPLIATKGYTAPEVERACSTARELCQQIGESPQLFAVLVTLYSVYANRGDFQKSLELAHEILRLAESKQEPLLLLWAHYCLGHILSLRGELEAGRAHTERSIMLYDFEQPREYGSVQDPGATGLARLAHLLYLLGYPDQALEKSLKALAHARKLSQPFTLAWVLGSEGAMHARRGEFQEAEQLWTEQVALCTEHNFPSLLASGIAGRAMAMVEQGRGQEAISRIRNSLEPFPAANATPEQLTYFLRLAYAYRRLGWSKEGLAVVVQALKLLKETSIPESADLYSADLYHLKGEMLLIEDATNQPEAQRCFRAAIEIARSQGARSWELEATTSLARSLMHEGRRAEASTMLADIYGWFTEGFDTPALTDAKALLDELSR
jgi:tetratricopeptide (TPR) repeat protein